MTNGNVFTRRYITPNVKAPKGLGDRGMKAAACSTCLLGNDNSTRANNVLFAEAMPVHTNPLTHQTGFTFMAGRIRVIIRD